MAEDMIINMARALSRAIQLDRRYLALREASDTNDADTALQDAIGRFNLARINLNSEISGEARDDARVAELNGDMQRAYEEVMASDGMARYEEAKDEVNRLVGWINAIIMGAVAGEDPDGIEAPASCAGGCDGCQGCG